MINKIIDRLLNRYDSSSYSVKSRARFLLYSILTLLILIPLIISLYSYFHFHDQAYHHTIQLRVIGPLAIAFILSFFLLIILYKGYFSVAGNLLLVFWQSAQWTIMFLANGDLVARIDTIVIIAAQLAAMPIIIVRKKTLFLFYTLINIAMLFLFMFLSKKELNLTETGFIDYLSDNTLSFIFIGIFSYTIYSINSRALEKAESEISERIKSEEQRNKLQSQLMQSQKLESVGLLAGGVAHDFNNMLAAVQGFAELAAERIDSENPVKIEICEIIKASKKARDLTRQLLAFARIQPLDIKKIDLNHIIRDFTGMLSRTLHGDIIIQNNLCTDPGLIEGDPVQIEQIILNLTLNSQDAMPNGGTIIIETSRVHIEGDFEKQYGNITPGPYILLSISDSGSGVDPDIINKIFDPFFTTKDPGRGTGLGLSTVYGIIKQHGGMISVFSEKEKGTIFKIYLPIKDGASEITPLPADKMNHFKGDETILAVEDNPEVRNLLESILKKNGYRALIAENADAAMSIASGYEGVIHLLIADVILPDSNGRTLYNKISLIRPEIKAIYISGYTANVIAHNGKLDDGINFIQKPFSISDFARKMREVLDSK